MNLAQAGSELVSQRLVLHETALGRQADALLIELRGLEVPAGDPGDLRPQQRRLMSERGRVDLRPPAKSGVDVGQGQEALLALGG